VARPPHREVVREAYSRPRGWHPPAYSWYPGCIETLRLMNSTDFKLIRCSHWPTMPPGSVSGD